jgi:two-component system sensor histidine kinase TctE
VDNALRYTPAGGTVTVTVAARREGTTLLVEDTGPGIPVEERERVFERFYRIQNEASDGCGLGLAIVREIANAVQARVSLSDPETGRGLVVKVEFGAPAQAAVAAPRPPDDAKPTSEADIERTVRDRRQSTQRAHP